MATFTITAAQNIDELTTKAGADTYNVNGGTLTIDQNTFFGHNTGTAGGLGNITISASLGGTVEIDGRYVRQIQYSGGSGFVPAYNTVISAGGLTGKFIGAVSTLTSTPAAPAAGLPSTGYLLIKQWNGVSCATNDAITGSITCTASGPDVPGVLMIFGNENASRSMTSSRLGLFRVRGEWYTIATTSGTATTAYSVPNYGLGNNVAGCLPGVWVETGTDTGVYEFYPRAVVTIGSSENLVHKKVCYVSSGNLYIGSPDGAASAGYAPPSGRKIRVPNVWLLDTTAATAAVPTTTITNRPEFAVAGGGVLSMDKALSCWWANLSTGYSISLTNCAFADTITLSEIATAPVLTNTHVGPISSTAQTPLTVNYCYAGGTFSNCTFTRASFAASGYAITSSDCNALSFTNVLAGSFLSARGNATVGNLFTRVSNSTFSAFTMIAGGTALVTCTNVSFTNSVYFDRSFGLSSNLYAQFAFSLATKCDRITIDGYAEGAPQLGPASSIVTIGTAGHTATKIRNIGSFASPVATLGTFAQYSWTRSTTTATVTWTGHGFQVNDRIFVRDSSATSAITNLTVYAVATVLTADTFTMTCLNAGAASGTIVAAKHSTPVFISAAAAVAMNDLKIQRVYFDSLPVVSGTLDNSNKNVLLEDSKLTYHGSFTLQALNMTIRNSEYKTALTAQTGTYGVHWVDAVIGRESATTSVTWTRSSTTVTITATGHGITPNDETVITGSSSIAALPNGKYTITALGTANTFNVTGINAGAASGTATVNVLRGRMTVMMNEATAETASHYTFDAGSPKFTSTGLIYMPAVDDQVTWTTPHFIKNVSGFPVAEPILTGTSITLSNHEAYYALDTGSGFGSFKQLMYSRAGGGGSNASTDVTMTSTTGVVVGSYVFGTNVAYGAKVQSITNGTTIVVDIANIGTVSGVLRFSELPNETISDTATGFKMKMRLKSVVANTSTTISSVHWFTTPSGTNNQYPLDTNTLTLTGLQSGSDVVILTAGTSTILAQADSVSGTTYAYTFSGAQNVDIGVLKPGRVPLYVRNLALTAVDSSLPIAQVADRNYS